MTCDLVKQPKRLARLNRPSAVLLAGLFVGFGLVSSAIGDDQFAFSKGSFYKPNGSAVTETQPFTIDSKSSGPGDQNRIVAPKAPDLDPTEVTAPDASLAGEAGQAPAMQESTAGMAGMVGAGGFLDAGGGDSGESFANSGDQRNPEQDRMAAITSKNNFGDSSFEPANPQDAPPPAQPDRSDNRPPGNNFDENDFDRPAAVSRPQKPIRNRVSSKPPRHTERRRQAKPARRAERRRQSQPRKRTRQRRRVQRQARARRKGWICRASSSTGSWGWGANRSRRSANRRALTECAIRTPRGRVCYSRGCRAVY